MNREDYLKLLGGDVDIALEVCTNADEWVDSDPVALYHAAEIVARAYRRLAADYLTLECP